jgi:hypothetical protein
VCRAISRSRSNQEATSNPRRVVFALVIVAQRRRSFAADTVFYGRDTDLVEV